MRSETEDKKHTVRLSDQEAETLRMLLERGLDRASVEQQDELLGLLDKIPESESRLTQDAVRRKYDNF